MTQVILTESSEIKHACGCIDEERFYYTDRGMIDIELPHKRRDVGRDQFKILFGSGKSLRRAVSRWFETKK